MLILRNDYIFGRITFLQRAHLTKCRDSHRREYCDGNHTDLHTDLHMVGHGSDDDDCATGVLHPKQARHNRQRTIYAR